MVNREGAWPTARAARQFPAAKGSARLQSEVLQVKVPARAPAPHPHDHDHALCIDSTMTRIEQICAEKGLRLTPLRRKVARLLADTHRPLGAYEIVERLAADGEQTPPMSVYRVLDFLVAEGLAHRIESRNAYLACVHPHGDEDVVVFLICEQCGLTQEVSSHAVGRDLAWASRAVGFTPRQRVLEIAGSCARCRDAAEQEGAAAGAPHAACAGEADKG